MAVLLFQIKNNCDKYFLWQRFTVERFLFEPKVKIVTLVKFYELLLKK